MTTSKGDSTGIIEFFLEKEHAFLCISIKSPAKTFVISWNLLRVTSRLKSTPVSLQISLMSSCIGFPSMIPHFDFGCFILSELCRVKTVSIPDRPGLTIFAPPLNPAKK